MDWNNFGRFMSAVMRKRGVYVDFCYMREDERLMVYRLEGSHIRLYKAFGYDWGNNCLGEVQWDGKCFFAPEGTNLIRYVIVDDYADIDKIDEAWEMANGL